MSLDQGVVGAVARGASIDREFDLPGVRRPGPALASIAFDQYQSGAGSPHSKEGSNLSFS